MANLSSNRNIHLSPATKDFRASLSEQGQSDFQEALVHLATNSDNSKSLITCCGFWIIYRVVEDGSIHIGNVINAINYEK